MTQDDRQHQATTRRRQANNIRLLYGMLALLTLYFAGLNLFVVWRIQSRPFQLDLESSHYSLSTPGAKLLLDWEDLPDAQEASGRTVRPSLQVNGVDLGSVGSVPVDGPLELAVAFPPNVTVGRHVGELTIQLPQVAREDWPNCPVIVDFATTPWRVWFILRNWLIAALLLTGAIYLFCVALFPVPAGRLLVHRSLSSLTPHGSSATRRAVVLSMAPSAVLFPWKRSHLSLSGVLDRGGVSLVNQPEGTLWFTDSRMAPILLFDVQPSPDLYRRQLSTENPDLENMKKVLDSEEMTADREYLFMDPLSKTWVSFHWAPRAEGH